MQMIIQRMLKVQSYIESPTKTVEVFMKYSMVNASKEDMLKT